MRPWASRAAPKSLQLVRYGFGGRFVESSGAALDPRRFDASDLRGAHDGWRGQPGAREIGDCYIARPWRIVAAGDHRHPDEPEGCELAIGYDQRRPTLFGETVGVRKRHHDDVEGGEAVLPLPSPLQGRVASSSAQCTRLLACAGARERCRRWRGGEGSNYNSP
jgi:hypothetical protein